jgi:hypothetical protein
MTLRGRSLLACFALIAFGPQGLAVAQCGYTWIPHGLSSTAAVLTLASLPGNCVAAGGLFQVAGTTVSNIAVLDRNSGTWDSLAGGSDGPVFAVAVRPNGDLLAGGHFSTVGGVPANNIARWNGTNWLPFGSGTSGGSSTLPGIRAFATMPNGDLVAAGDFTAIDGVPAPALARWNGTTWSTIGTLANGHLIYALEVMPNGDLVIGGDTFVERWNGATWTTIGSTGGWVSAMSARANGDLVVAGSFNRIDSVNANNIARWDGTAWHPLALGLDWNARALATLPDGDLIVGGNFDYAFNQGGFLFVDGLARWNGTTWSGFGPGADDYVYAIARNSDDTYTMAGIFDTIGGLASPALASMATTCPAGASAFGSGCAGSAGPVVLAATSLPWLGSTCRARTTGVPANAIAIGVLGLGQVVVPLSPVLPAGPGCFLLASPDVLDLQFPTAGVVTTSFAVPDTLAVLGLSIRHQVVPFEFGAGGSLLAVSASNSVVLTVGSF